MAQSHPAQPPRLRLLSTSLPWPAAQERAGQSWAAPPHCPLPPLPLTFLRVPLPLPHLPHPLPSPRSQHTSTHGLERKPWPPLDGLASLLGLPHPPSPVPLNTKSMAPSVPLLPRPRPRSGPSPRPLAQEASLDASAHTQCRSRAIAHRRRLSPQPKSFDGSHCLRAPGQALSDLPPLPHSHQGSRPSKPVLTSRKATLLKDGPDSHPFPSQTHGQARSATAIPVLPWPF